MRKKLYGAIEAGGTKFNCEVVDEAGKIRASVRLPTTTPAETLGEVQKFFAAHKTGTASYAAFGIASFGPLDLHRGSPTFGQILGTPKPHWSGVDLVSPLTRQFKCPVELDTDVNAAALAEALMGAGQGCNNVVYVTVGTGIGGGVCIKGNTLHGALHPEMGHIRVQRRLSDIDFAGSCPFHGGCLEGLASGTAIVTRYGMALDQLPPKHEAYLLIGHYLGQLATNILLLLAPERLIFGGGVMRNSRLYDEIRGTVSTLLKGYAGLGVTKPPLTELIVAPGLGERSGILGALVLAQRAAKVSRADAG